MANKNEFRDLMRLAEQAGWKVEKSRKGHLKWNPPNGGMTIFSAATPSDVRAVKNHRALLRRAGLAV